MVVSCSKLLKKAATVEQMWNKKDHVRIDTEAKGQTVRRKGDRWTQTETTGWDRHLTLSPNSLHPGKLTWWGPTVPVLSSLDTDHGWLLESSGKFWASKQLSRPTQKQGTAQPDQFTVSVPPFSTAPSSDSSVKKRSSSIWEEIVGSKLLYIQIFSTQKSKFKKVD